MTHGIDVGGQMKGCVQITVNVPDERFAHDERFAVVDEASRILQREFTRGGGPAHAVQYLGPDEGGLPP
jgi:hypothetical protein